MSLRESLLILILFLQLAGGAATYYIFQGIVTAEASSQKDEAAFRQAEQARLSVERFAMDARERLDVWLNRGFRNASVQKEMGEFLAGEGYRDLTILQVSEEKITHLAYIEAGNSQLTAPPAPRSEVPTNVGPVELRSSPGGPELLFRSGEILARFSLDPKRSHALAEQKFLLLGWPGGDVLLSSGQPISPQILRRIRAQLNQQPDFPWVDESWTISPLPSLKVAIVIPSEQNSLESKWNSVRLLFVSSLALLMGMGIVVTTLIVGRLTSAVESVVAATVKISEGHFDVQSVDRGPMEIRRLSHAVQTMARQIQDLIRVRVEKERQSAELRTAQAVQNALLPEHTSHQGRVSLAGFSQMASECGGDLWGYWEVHGATYVYVFDVTGHGVAAALVSSAARGVILAAQKRSEESLETIASEVHHAVASVGHGERMMTGFLARIKQADGTLEFINLSHPDPFLVHDGQGEVQVEVIIAEKIQSSFGHSDDKREIETRNLVPGDWIVLLSDGVFDLPTARGKKINEREFARMLKSLEGTKEMSVDELREAIRAKIFASLGESELSDDVTFVCVRWRPFAQG